MTGGPSPSPGLLCCLVVFCQKQLTRLQEVLARRDAASRGSPAALSHPDPAPRNALVLKLRQLVAQKEAKVKELEREIQQLSLKVRGEEK